ncbi:MAG: D-aminoacyl-tRNA deacylase [Candidatus Gracilibacteria bacterium]
MKALIQRVTKASVTVNGSKISEIGKGILIFLGITHGDNEKDIQYLIEKISNLRIFEGQDGKLDLSVKDTGGEFMLVSQFTLYGDCNKGRRPDFNSAAPIDEARAIYEKACSLFQQSEVPTKTGQFQANMQVELTNDGPFTLMIESKK